MAFVPELDDPNKKDESEDTSDISAQAAPTTAAAPATGGQAVGGNPANSSTKSSGNFQDFSKFKAANQNKLSALSNLATGQAQGNVDKAKSALDNAGSAYQAEIQKNAKNFDTSGYKDLTVNSDIDADKIGQDIAVTKQDAGAYQGKLAGTEAYTGLQSAENQVGQLGTRAGTAGVLGQYGAEKGDYSGTAANQDALLLQSMGDYRQKANQIAQDAKGVTERTYQLNKDKIGETATKVDNQNQDYRTKALDALGGVQGQIKKDLTDRAQTEYMAAEDKEKVAQRTAINSHLSDKLAKQLDFLTNDPLLSQGKGAQVPMAQVKQAQEALARGDNRLALELTGMTNDEVEKMRISALTNSGIKGITASSVLGSDQKRQNQLSGLERLLGTGIDISASGGPVINSVDELVRSLGGRSQAIEDQIRQNPWTLEKVGALDPIITEAMAKSLGGGVPTPTRGGTSTTGATNNRKSNQG